MQNFHRRGAPCRRPTGTPAAGGCSRTTTTLEIDFKKINPDIVDRIEEEINLLDKKIKDIKNDVMWKWYYCNKAQQEEIFRQLTAN